MGSSITKRRLASLMTLAAALAVSACATSEVSLAQTSASYKLTEFAFNAGGDPANGTSGASAHFHIKLDAIGDAASGTVLTSASYRSDAGFVSDYPPPGEIKGLGFTSTKTKLKWDPERSIGTYAVYRNSISSLPGGFGTCLTSGLTGETATDGAVPATGQGFFYLVTARNRLTEEGTKGYQTNGAERSNSAPCP